MDRRSTALGCEGTILVHDDRSCTCTEAACESSESRLVAISRHAWFLACRDVLGAECPVCAIVRAGG